MVGFIYSVAYMKCETMTCFHKGTGSPIVQCFVWVSKPGGGEVLQKILTGVCRPWYDTLYPIVGQILDKIIPYNIGQIFKIGPRSDIIFSKNANFYSKMKNVARRHFCPKSPIFFSSENRIIFKLSYPIVGQNNQRQTLL